MNEIQVFSNQEFGSVRIVRDEIDDPLFAASDIAKALGYRMASDMTRRLDEDEKGTRSVRTPGGDQRMTVITESGLYSAILGSQVEGAKAFKRWVTHEVLPSIRRDGGYMAARDETPEETMARALLMADSTIRRQRALIADLEPRAALADALSPGMELFTVTETARQVAGVLPGVTRQDVFDLLRRCEVMCKASTQPTRHGIDTGRMAQVASKWTDGDGRERTSLRGKLTAKGVAWIISKLAEGRAA